MQIRYTTDAADVTAALDYASKSGLFLDLETTGLDPRKDTIVHIVLASGPDSAIVVPPSPLVLSLLAGSRPIFFCAHNMKFDLAFLYNAGVDLRNNTRVFRDTMLIQHLISEEGPFALDDLVQARWDDPYKTVFWGKYKAYEDAPIQDQAEYAGKDVIYTQRLYAELLNEFKADLLPEFLLEHTHDLAMALYDTEVVGIKIDLEYITALGVDLISRSGDILTKLNEQAGPDREAVEFDTYVVELEKRKTEAGKARVPMPKFNWSSNQQLMALLYDKMKLPVQKMKRKPTVNDEALEALAGHSPVVSMLRDYRKLLKVYTSFIEGTISRAHNGRVYPKFNINGTVTGRISSSGPNFQQIPRDGGVRGIYVPDDGKVFVSADQGQLEVVVACHYSQDPNLLKILYEGASKHDITAEALGIERSLAKTLNFAAQYGATATKFASILGCSIKEAEDVFNRYWDVYSGERRVVEDCKQLVDDGMPIVNIVGRRRRFPSHFDGVWQKEAAYRAAYSALIQGSGADLVHAGTIAIARKLRETGLGRLVAEIHDEVIVELKPEDYEIVADIVKTEMELPGKTYGLTVPLTAVVGPPMKRWEK